MICSGEYEKFTLPREVLMAISKMLTALKYTSLSGVSR